MKKVWQVQLDHLEGNPAREQPALLRQLSFFVVSLSFCVSVCFCVFVYLLYCIFVFSLRAGECMAQPAVPTFAHQLAIWLSPCSFAILPFFVFLFFSAFCLSLFVYLYFPCKSRQRNLPRRHLSTNWPLFLPAVFINVFFFSCIFVILFLLLCKQVKTVKQPTAPTLAHQLAAQVKSSQIEK